jgi:hypothetical protein
LHSLEGKQDACNSIMTTTINPAQLTPPFERCGDFGQAFDFHATGPTAPLLRAAARLRRRTDFQPGGDDEA